MVLVKFPADESDKLQKLARPWHGPYRVTEVNEPNISVSNVYHPKKETIKIHQSRVKHCPVNFPAGFYWYGGKRKGPGRPPKWVEQLLAGKDADKAVDKEAEIDVTKASTEQRDLTIRNDRTEISDESHGVIVDESARVPRANNDTQPRARNTRYGLRQHPRCNKKWMN